LKSPTYCSHSCDHHHGIVQQEHNKYTNNGTETYDKAVHMVAGLSNIDRSKVGYPD